MSRDKPPRKKPISTAIGQLIPTKEAGIDAPADAPEFQIQVHQSDDGRVILRFSQPLTWFALTPNEAVDFARLVVKHAEKAGAGRILVPSTPRILLPN